MDSESMFRNVGVQGGLVDRVVNEIQRVIVSGQLEPGMKLLPEREAPLSLMKITKVLSVSFLSWSFPNILPVH